MEMEMIGSGLKAADQVSAKPASSWRTHKQRLKATLAALSLLFSTGRWCSNNLFQFMQQLRKKIIAEY